MEAVGPQHAVRVAIGPANHAGQAWGWAEALRRELDVPAFSFGFGGLPFRQSQPFSFQVHQHLPHHRLTSRLMKRLLVDRLLGGTTHLALDGFVPLYDRIDRSILGDEFARYRHHKKLALIAHGSDVRDPDGHKEREEFSYFREAPGDYISFLRIKSAQNRETALQSGVPLLVSTPDLIEDLPSASWLPLVSSPVAVGAESPRRTPVVLHGPSSRRPAIKGTDWIDPVLRRLETAGRIIYLRPQGQAHKAFQQLVARSDIVVDQILSGSYGVTSVEAMLAGKITIANVSSWVQVHLPEPVPAVPANPESFGEVMESILSDLPRYHLMAERGRAFALKWHTGRASALILATALGIEFSE